MATLHLLSAAPNDPARFPKARLDLEQLRACAAVDRYGVHATSDDPEKADAILFVEVSDNAGAYFERVRRHPLRRRFRDKTLVFCSTDRVVPLVPGVYASIERSWHSSAWARPSHYLGVREGGELRYVEAPGPPKHLLSFVGTSRTHPVRTRIMALRAPDALLIDAADEPDPPPPDEYARRYADAIRDSAFVLCPRGGGTATFRLYETMMLGRAPVIVSDEWVAPDGPDWKLCSIRVAERDVERIPSLLGERRAEAAAMGAAAREAWVRWFSESASFHSVAESCVALLRAGPQRSGLRRLTPYRQMLRPYHAARWAAKRARLS